MTTRTDRPYRGSDESIAWDVWEEEKNDPNAYKQLVDYGALTKVEREAERLSALGEYTEERLQESMREVLRIIHPENYTFEESVARYRADLEALVNK